jgi:DNA-binding LacI/PurR family transcriptional regulator
VVFVSGPFGGSVSAQLECQGLMAGLETHGRGDITFEVLPVRNVQEEEGDQVISASLESGAPTPDAVFCFGDRLALGVVRALRQRGLNVPEQVSVVGATGLDLTGTACPRLTRLDQSFRVLGETVIAMVCERIEKQGIALPGQFVPTRFMGGATTREKENELLSISEQ